MRPLRRVLTLSLPVTKLLRPAPLVGVLLPGSETVLGVLLVQPLEVGDPLEIFLERLDVRGKEGVETLQPWEWKLGHTGGRKGAHGEGILEALLGQERGDGPGVGPPVCLGDSSLDLRGVKFRVGVGGVPVPTPPAAEHHVAAGDCALVHLPQMHSAEMDLERTLVTERLHANIALDPLLPGGRTHVCYPNVVGHGGALPEALGVERAAPTARVRLHLLNAVLPLRNVALRLLVRPREVEGPAKVAGGLLGRGLGQGHRETGEGEHGEGSVHEVWKTRHTYACGRQGDPVGKVPREHGVGLGRGGGGGVSRRGGG